MKFSNVECIYRKYGGYYRILDKVQKEAEARKSEAKREEDESREHIQLIYHCPLLI